MKDICIKEPIHKLGNWLDSLLSDVPGVVDPLLGNSDHSSTSFSVKMGFKIPNITFSQKVYLKSRVDWPHVGDDLLNHNSSAVYNSPNPVSDFNKVITYFINRRVPSKFIRRKVNDKTWFNEDSINAFQNIHRLWSQII